MTGPGDGESTSLAARIERLEARSEIAQLVARYALALDSRDVDALVALFVEDVAIGDGRTGRAALAEWFDGVLRPYRATFHLLGGHVIDLHDATHASGILYCRPEHEVGDLWIVMALQYWDRYERRDGQWLFKSRKPQVLYSADVAENPLAVEGRFNFPGNPTLHEATLPHRWESWRRFWREEDAAGAPLDGPKRSP
jgi:ketosteroid isomerase-like protein